jgi:dihydroorotate dehydrogenase electron transfer subunit
MNRPPRPGPAREDGAVLLRTDYARFTGVEVSAPRTAERIRPGQFVSVPAPYGIGPPGRWMLSPAAVRRDGGDASTLRLVARRGERGPGALDRLRPGDLIPLIGPLGSPLRLNATPGTTVVGVGHGAATACLIASDLHADGRSCRVSLFVPPPVEENSAPWLEAAAPPGVQVESTPRQPEWADRIEELAADADQFVVAAPATLAYAVSRICRDRAIPCQVLLEPFMACGVGLCLTCAVPLADGRAPVRACVDGPFFPADDIDWRLLVPRGAA